MDDEEMVCGLLAEVLVPCGHSVMTVLNREDALKAMSDGGDFDLVITDLDHSGLKGYELSEKILGDFPGISVIVCSGYITVTSFSGRGGVSSLSKPFDIEMLRDWVKEILGD